MGMYSDLFASAKTIDVDDSDNVRYGGTVYEQLRQYSEMQGDPPAPAAFEGEDEVQEIPQAESDDGTYTLTVSFVDGDGVTHSDETAALDHDAVAATVEAAIDTVLADLGSPVAFVAGDIAITGGPIDAAAMTATFSGASVAKRNHPLITVTSSLTLTAAPVAAPTVTEETAGGVGTASIAILASLGVITCTDPPESGSTTGITAGSNLLAVKPPIVRALAREAAHQLDTPALEAVILAAAGLHDPS